MRDVSAKGPSLREATAEAIVRLKPESVRLIHDGKAPKGDPRPVARVAAIQAAKSTAQIVPYCHPVPIDFVGVEFELRETEVVVRTHVKAVYKTGVEIEALTAAAVAALNVLDLLKPVDDTIEIHSVRLLKKTGGKSQFALPQSFTFSIVIASDRCAAGKSEDNTTDLAKTFLTDQGGSHVSSVVVPDDPPAVSGSVQAAAASSDFVLVSGGTGLGPRDTTPEAILPLLERRLHGVEHRILSYALDRYPQAMLGRPVAGTVGRAVIVAVPGSPSAVADALAALFPYVTHGMHVLEGGDHDV